MSVKRLKSPSSSYPGRRRVLGAAAAISLLPLSSVGASNFPLSSSSCSFDNPPRPSGNIRPFSSRPMRASAAFVIPGGNGALATTNKCVSPPAPLRPISSWRAHSRSAVTPMSSIGGQCEGLTPPSHRPHEFCRTVNKNTAGRSCPAALRATPADEEDAESSSESGSVLGASLLFAGTAVGAGMLALPAETAPAGFVPSVSSLLICWAFTFVTSLVTLEATWMSDRMSCDLGEIEEDGGVGFSGEEEEACAGGGFLSIGKYALGPVGEAATAFLFWFLLTSIIVAYTSEGGTILSEFSSEQFGVALDARACSAAFMAFFASLAVFGTERVDLVNRLLVAGLVGTFLGLVGVGLPMIDSALLSRADWTAVYPPLISVGILSFGAQNVVPTLLRYLGGDAIRTRRAVLIGSLIPLVMYALWEAVFLGVIPWVADGDEGSKMQVVAALGTAGGTVVQELVEVFSACAIGSSMAGASVSLVDFFQDAFSELNGAVAELAPESNPELNEGQGQGRRVGTRLGAAALALGPPLGLACAYPDAFLGALENAGLIGGVSLYGILPALAVIKLRRDNAAATVLVEGGGGSVDSGESEEECMPGRLGGGMAALYFIAAVSIGLVVPEFARLGGSLVT